MKKKSPDNIDHHIHEHDQLSGLRRMDVFSTPDNYFEKLPIAIADRISSSPSHESGILVKFPKLVMASAIIAALLITGSLYYLNQEKAEKAQVILTYDDLILSGMAYDYDDKMLIEYYLSLPAVASSDNSDAIQDENMNNYLIENNVDITLIINEL